MLFAPFKQIQLTYSILVVILLSAVVSLHSPASANNPIAAENLQRQARHFLSIAREGKQFSDDLMMNAYVLDLAKKLAKSADIEVSPLHYYVIKDPVTNAFAGPGATFFLNSGLIELTENEGELVAVMSHELAHFKQDHLNRLLNAYQSTQVPTLLAVLAGLAIGGDAGVAAIVGAQAAQVDSVIEHTLSYEREADNAAVRIMADSGYDPIHAKNFMVALEQEIRESGLIQSNIHNTHPVTPERIASISARLRRFEGRPFPALSTEFLFFKARNRVLFHWQSNKTHLHFERRLSKGTEVEQLANRYGYALSIARDGDTVRARQLLEELATKQPNNLWILLAWAELELSENPVATLAMLKLLANVDQPHPAVVELYTKALLNLNSFEQAHQYLRPHLATNPEHIQLLALSAHTAAYSGAMGDAYLADADYHFKMGDLDIALNKLKFAEKNSDDFVTVAIAREKIRRINEELEWRKN